MFAFRSVGLLQATLFLQGCLLMALYWLVYGLFQWFEPGYLTQTEDYYSASMATLLAFFVFSLLMTRTQEQLLFGGNRGRQILALRQTGFVALGFLAAIVLFRAVEVSRSFVVAFLIVTYLFNFWSVGVLPKWVSNLLLRGINSERLLVVGTERRVRQFMEWLKQTEILGVSVEAVLLLEERSSTEAWTGHADLNDRVRELLDRREVTQIVVTEIVQPATDLGKLVRLANQRAIRLMVVNNLSDVFRHSISTFRYLGIDFIGFRDEPLQNPFNRLVKRLLDLLIATPTVLFLLPFLTVVVWVMQRFQSPGPVFYKQQRAGAHQAPFLCWKFRTMHIGPHDEAQQASQHDPRIYPFARWLRRTSLDEIPQFWNVLTGQMSVVGPRPHLVIHNERFASVMNAYHIRSLVKPGITGLAQIRGFRGEIQDPDDIVQRARSDIEYIENWTLTGDLLIIFRTAAEVLVPPRSAF